MKTIAVDHCPIVIDGIRTAIFYGDISTLTCGSVLHDKNGRTVIFDGCFPVTRRYEDAVKHRERNGWDVKLSGDIDTAQTELYYEN